MFMQKRSLIDIYFLPNLNCLKATEMLKFLLLGKSSFCLHEVAFCVKTVFEIAKISCNYANNVGDLVRRGTRIFYSELVRLSVDLEQ